MKVGGATVSDITVAWVTHRSGDGSIDDRHGVRKTIPRNFPLTLWHPSGMRVVITTWTGGVVALLLNHRLMSGNPPGSGRGGFLAPRRGARN